ncbi:MAG TPA: anti-sigma factor [Burkholderiales bacterium]|nr:anti-sigma factor [Burkholderiales bacterium]
MRIGSSPLLDALCGEYVLGTLRGPARRRLARARREEPQVAARLRYWEETFMPEYTTRFDVAPSKRTWRALERELGLARYRPAWYRRAGFWRNWALGATFALALAVGLRTPGPESPQAPAWRPIAQLSAAGGGAPGVTAGLSADGGTLELRAARPVLAGSAQSYELWLLPAGGGAPVSLAVLGSLDARVALAPGRRPGLRAGAKLAVSVEPAGGSPTGAPTGPVILVGEVGNIS